MVEMKRFRAEQVLKPQKTEHYLDSSPTRTARRQLYLLGEHPMSCPLVGMTWCSQTAPTISIAHLVEIVSFEDRGVPTKQYLSTNSW